MAGLTRQRAVAAAGELFARHGYGATTVRRVIDLSGLTKGALYFYFPDKEALATAVLARLDVAPDPPDDPVRLQALITLTHRYWTALDTDPVLCGAAVLAGHPDLAPPQVHRAPLAVVTRLLEEAARAGELLPGTVGLLCDFSHSHGRWPVSARPWRCSPCAA